MRRSSSISLVETSSPVQPVGEAVRASRSGPSRRRCARATSSGTVCGIVGGPVEHGLELAHLEGVEPARSREQAPRRARCSSTLPVKAASASLAARVRSGVGVVALDDVGVRGPLGLGGGVVEPLEGALVVRQEGRRLRPRRAARVARGVGRASARQEHAQEADPFHGPEPSSPPGSLRGRASPGPPQERQRRGPKYPSRCARGARRISRIRSAINDHGLAGRAVREDGLRGRLGPAPDLRARAQVPPARRDRATCRGSGPGRRTACARCCTRSRPSTTARSSSATNDTDFAYEIAGLARFRANLLHGPHGPGRRLPPDPDRDPHGRAARPAAGRPGPVPPVQGPGAGHRPDRQRQVDHAGGDDRPHQPHAQRPHHHDRGPDRVRAPATSSA